MKIKDVTSCLESIAPLSYQETYDNSGLIVGNFDAELTGVLVSLDCIESVVDEAINRGCNLVVAHHPIVFSGLKKINGNNYIERTVIKAIKNDIGIYAIHTNLDNVKSGVNKKIADKIGLTNLEILSPKPGSLKKLVVHTPMDAVKDLQEALFDNGAGKLREYSNCSFLIDGVETFKPNNSSNPVVGEIGKLYEGKSVKLEVIFPGYLERRIISLVHKVHPYEKPAIDSLSLNNPNSEVGSGMIGEFKKPLEEKVFLELLKKSFKANGIRYSQLLNKPVKRVAVCGGSGSFLLKTAINAKADFFVSGDFKYHQFFDAEEKIVIADIGHFESEQFTIELIGELLCEKFHNFAVYLSDINTNPINYF